MHLVPSFPSYAHAYMAIGIYCIDILKPIFMFWVHIDGKGIKMLTLWHERRHVRSKISIVYVERIWRWEYIPILRIIAIRMIAV